MICFGFRASNLVFNQFMDKKVQKLIETSIQIIKDASLENGAIVAANSDKEYYPRQAKDYHYVWPRDAAYICVAAQMAGIRTIQEPFFHWLNYRPENFKKEGLLFANYSTNGRMEVDQFQPDQAGSVLWAIYNFYKDDLAKAEKQEVVIRRLADGLCSEWRGKYFFRNTVDLWEESNRKTSTRMENNHTYSLAACAKGLLLAHKMLGNIEWEDVARQMIERIDDSYDHKQKRFLRNHGRIDDPNIDASLLGLTYPFEIILPDDARMIQTVSAIEKNITINGGVHRFQFDYYDGEGSAQEGAGAWPILNFWMSIYYSLRNDRKKSEAYFMWVVEKIKDDYMIPEQIFSDFREGIRPLVWSHAMFLIASKYLGYL